MELPTDSLIQIFSYFRDEEVYPYITVNKKFCVLLLPRWQRLVLSSYLLQRQRRQYYHKRSTTLSISYDSVERASSRKFLGFNFRLGVSCYTETTAGVNIFVRVRPCAMGHEVGSVFTWTGWKNEEISRGWWVKNIQDSEEVWRINISYNEVCKDLWFSVFVRDSSGNEVWDSNDGWNYSANLDSLPTIYYRTNHPAVIQYEQTKETSRYYDNDTGEICEEQWFNVNHKTQSSLF
jgi:hypothetical protein